LSRRCGLRPRRQAEPKCDGCRDKSPQFVHVVPRSGLDVVLSRGKRAIGSAHGS
jgi:hypothetical protein